MTPQILGFLHRHPKLEQKCELDENHVIVDKKDWVIQRTKLSKCVILEFHDISEIPDIEICDQVIVIAGVTEYYTAFAVYVKEIGKFYWGESWAEGDGESRDLDEQLEITNVKMWAYLPDAKTLFGCYEKISFIP